MYLLTILLLMGVFPVLSIAAETLLSHGAVDPIFVVVRWFVFWGVGIRLLAAGIRQVIEPSFTARTIYRFEDPAAHKIVMEVGFGNLAIGTLGALTLLNEIWLTPAAIAGAVFFGLAGIKHLFNRGKTREETIAMISDLALSVLLLAYLVARYIAYVAIASF